MNSKRLSVIHATKPFSTKRSEKLKQKPAKFLPDGVADSILLDNAQGSHIWDVDGNEYIDYNLGSGSVILGHSYPAVQDRVHEYDKKGVIYGFDTPLEITIAEKIESIVPSAEMIRFYVSGTETTMHAIKIARAYTGKEKILKFEGQYHGVHDYVSFSTAPSAESPRGKAQPDSIGIPKAVQKLTLVNQWNDFDAVEKTIRKESNNIAAIITEPVMANAAVIPPQDGYLKFLKELCDKNDIVLIFDEVKTGFRISKGGAQELFGVKPHLTALAKSFGNGYPISAVVGLREIMKDNANRKILHQGTYARNPVSLAAADATIDEISKGHVHRNIERFGAALMKGITDILHDRKVDGIVQGYPSMFQVLLTKQDSVNNYREFLKCDREFSTKLQERLLKKGVMFGEPSFTCASHDNEDLQQTLEAFDASLQDSASSRSKSRK